MTRRERLDRIYGTLCTTVGQLTATAYPTEEPVPFRDRMKDSAHGKELLPGDRWGRNGSCAWIRLEGIAPAGKPGFEGALLLDVGGEACLYDPEGNPLKGFTNVQSEFTVALGKPAKRVWFYPSGWEGKHLVLWADAGANDLFGCKPENGIFIQAEFVQIDSEGRDLYYDLETLSYYADAVGTPEAAECAERALSLWEEDRKACRAFTGDLLRESPSKTDGNTVFALGHAHLDLAWLWPVRETKRKAVRTLSTVVSNMRRYPEYRFCVSQPQMLKWVKETHPGLYEDVRQLQKQGKVENLGGSWVEMDTNLPDGESLVRQLVFGQRYWKDEFGAETEILWLPDTFGYSAQLPQLMMKAGMPYFLTTKLSWNSVNKFPYSSFWWKGLDGTRVLTHLPPEGNYNSAARPDSVKKAEGGHCSMMLYGIGDGGGGPGMEHLERLKREKALPGLPAVRQDKARAFFSKLEEESGSLPVWEGELYLEKHQGTYTTQSRNKMYNRLCESELHLLEYLGAVAGCLCPDYVWKREQVRAIWEEVLLYQFHDILPGSAIDRVYAETDQAYPALLREIRDLQTEALEALEEADGTIRKPSLLNASPVANGEPLPGNGWKKPDAPALPYCFTPCHSENAGAAESMISEGNVLENECVRVVFTETGTVSSLIFKETNTESVDAESNKLLVYQDLCDGWEVPDVRDKPNESPLLQELRAESVSCGSDGQTVFRTQTYRFRDSAVRQTVRLRSGSARVEWETDAEWREPHTLLRAEFHPAVRSESAVCGVPFGELSRPTMHRDSWESAKREICFQGYCDLSDGRFGTAVMTDCKYGVDVRDSVFSLALLRTPTYPAKHADIGKHVFRYAFLPHKGGTESVRAEAFRMRDGIRVIPFLPDLSAPFAEADGLLLSAVKPAEDGHGVIVRFYNPTDRSGRTVLKTAPSLHLGRPVPTDLLEKPLPENGSNASGEVVEYGPFEVLTFRLPKDRNETKNRL